jgi:hypothetical protein
MPLIEWGMWSENWQTQSGHGVHRTREVKGVEAPGASRPNFTGVTVPWASPSDTKGKGVELSAGGKGGKSSI